MPEPEATGSAESLSDRDQLLVIAPPGCGKTEFLAQRAAELLPSILPGQKILALTFSNKAKTNLKNRLSRSLGPELLRRYVTIRNFHGHAWEIVLSHAPTIGLEVPSLPPDKRTQAEAIEPFLEGLTDREKFPVIDAIEEDLRTAKQRARSDDEVLTYLRTTAESRSFEIESRRQVNGQLFYDDLLRHAQRLLRHPSIARLYRAHYAAILVDEYQDLSPQQLDIALRTTDRNRTFVGDPLQGIYSWTGARPVEVERVLRRVCGVPHGLGKSYRSSPAVLKLLASVSAPLGGLPLEAADPSAWHEGGITTGGSFDDGTEEADYVVRRAREILQKTPRATIGVISRNGWRRSLIDTAVAAASDLPSSRWDLAVDDPRVIELIEAAVQRAGDSAEIEGIEAAVVEHLDAADIDTRLEVNDALKQLAKSAAALGSVRLALQQLRVRDDSSDVVAPGVHLLNAHTGKGQQFDWVFIPGFEEGNVPNSWKAKTRDQLLEEHRILLVMISRARHGVLMSNSRSLIAKNGRPRSPEPSRWRDLVVAGFTHTPDQVDAHLRGLT